MERRERHGKSVYQVQKKRMRSIRKTSDLCRKKTCRREYQSGNTAAQRAQRESRRSLGASLSEMLVTVLIVSFVMLAITGGIAAAVRSYRTISLEADARTLLATSITALSEKIEKTRAAEGSSSPAIEVKGDGEIDLAYYEGSGTSVTIQNNGESGIQITYGSVTEPLVTDKTSTLGLYTKLESASCTGDLVTFTIGTYRMADGTEKQVGTSRTVKVGSTVQTPASS